MRRSRGSPAAGGRADRRGPARPARGEQQSDAESALERGDVLEVVAVVDAVGPEGVVERPWGDRDEERNRDLIDAEAERGRSHDVTSHPDPWSSAPIATWWRNLRSGT